MGSARSRRNSEARAIESRRVARSLCRATSIESSSPAPGKRNAIMTDSANPRRNDRCGANDALQIWHPFTRGGAEARAAAACVRGEGRVALHRRWPPDPGCDFVVVGESARARASAHRRGHRPAGAHTRARSVGGIYARTDRTAGAKNCASVLPRRSTTFSSRTMVPQPSKSR